MSTTSKRIAWLGLTTILIACLGFGYWYWYLLGYTTEEEIHLLPKNFQGVVYIIFDSPAGIPQEYEANKRVYRIPGSGILRTRFKSQAGVLRAPEYYYILSDGQRIPIPYELPHKKYVAPGPFVSAVEAGSGGCQPDGKGHYNSLPYRSYVVADKDHDNLYYSEMNDEGKSPKELICDLNAYASPSPQRIK